MPRLMSKTTLLVALLAGGVTLGGVAFSQSHGPGMGQMMGGQGMGHRMGGQGGMPMLQGENTEPHEVEELRAMFMNHPDITRSVTNLPNGIVTVTESDDPALAAVLVSHVVGMIDRVEDNNDPKVPIQSPTLDILFANRDLITTTLDPTETGIKVTQTSDDPATVAALQKHAGEVSDLAERGMRAVRDSKSGNMMGRMMGN